MLNNLQTNLAALYEVEPPCDIDQFLVTDAQILLQLTGNTSKFYSKEQLLVSQNADTAFVTLYIDASILATLKQNDQRLLSKDSLNAYCIAIEGISHFLYMTWRIHHERPMTQLELELQAEIDKYIIVSQILTEQNQTTTTHLHGILFDNLTLHNNLNKNAVTRYSVANRYAAKYCNTFKNQLGDTGLQQPLINELRRFYRMGQAEKLRYIDTRN